MLDSKRLGLVVLIGMLSFMGILFGSAYAADCYVEFNFNIFQIDDVLKCMESRLDSAGGGEANTASNVGSGSGWFKQKSGVDLQFKSAIGNSGIVVTSNTNDLTLTPKYELLCSVTLGASNNTVTCAPFTARKNLQIMIEARSTGGTGVEPAMRFNSDSGTNYASRHENNGAADTTNTNVSTCRFGFGLLASGEAGMANGAIYNNQAGERKLGVGESVTGISTADTTAPFKLAWACKWDNTSAQITKIQMLSASGTGNFNTGSMLTVWGYD